MSQLSKIDEHEKIPGEKNNKKLSIGKNYRNLLMAVLFSNLGEGVSMTALPWLATALTGNAIYISLVALANRLPWLLFSLPFGSFIDYLPKKRLLIMTAIIRAGLFTLLALMVFGNWINLPLLTLLSFLIGITKVMYDSTAQAMVPLTVDEKLLERANGNFSSVQMVANDLLGRPLGGFLIALGIFIPFAFDAVTAILAILLLLNLKGSFRAEQSRKRFNLQKDILEGINYVWKHPLLRGLAVITMIANGIYSALLAVQVLFVQEILNLDSFGFGVLISTAAAGSILGSQCAAWLKNFMGTKKAMLTSLSMVGLSLGLVGLSSHWSIVGALYVIASFFIVVWSVLSLSLRQRVVPNHLLGRVGGTFFLLSWGVSSLGMLFGGFLVNLGEWWIDRDFGLRLPNLLFGVVYAILFFLAFRLFRRNQIDQLASD